MRVLEIYPNYCWSFEGDNSVVVRQLRAAAAISDDAIRNSEFDQIRNGHAYRLIGDATAFDLADDFFDEIHVEYTPTVLKRLLLAQKLKRWIKPDGKLDLPEAESQSNQPGEAYIPLRRPTLAAA
jgi:hypothetical protein